jgi:hypothetical protein
MEQTAYWFFADGTIRMRTADGMSHDATDDEVTAVLLAWPPATSKPCRMGC